MDNDLISRQAAIGALDGELTITGRENAETIRDYINGVDKKLRELPSAERRGRWLYKSELYSYCGHPFYPKICSVCNGVFEYTTNYCPNCGARMEAKE